MKLYLKASSERGKPISKGGNEYIDIDITVGTAQNPVPLASFTARYTDELENDDGTTTSGYAVYDNNDTILWWITEKDLQTKKIQFACRHDWDNYGKCTKCGKWNYTRVVTKKGVCVACKGKNTEGCTYC